ncbi:MAG: phosphate ABC transporter permease subunit PstC [Defluviitaleaceae bacterium]|nr:phosphate ABC transporter permease subunit PstC [Defluviitaleaceae bacterium]
MKTIENKINKTKNMQVACPNRKRSFRPGTEVITQILFLICGLISVSTLFIIIFFIFSRGVPAILTVGTWNFLANTNWSPFGGQFGILNFLAASTVTTLIAFLFGSRIGKWCAIYLVFFCPPKFYRPLKTIVELLGGIPSVLFGFFGIAVIVPFLRDHIGGHGNSLLAAIIVLSLMILPTVINLSEAAIRSVPKVYYEGALALGCNKTEAVFEVVVPSAKSGINSAYILGIGRAVGETMAVIMVAGNAPIFPDNILTPVRTLTTAIALEMGYATGLHRDVLFGIGVVLFLIIIILNATLTLMNRNATNFAKES